jgi:FkbM family methyltransferase
MLIPFSELFTKYNVRPKGILHIGASSGQEADEYRRCGVQNVAWVEADPEVYKQLQAHLRSFRNNTAYNALVGDTDGEMKKFNIASNDGQSSSIMEFGTHEAEHPTVKFVGHKMLYTTRIDTLYAEMQIDAYKYDFLNIDIQGAELLALKGMGHLLSNFKWAYIEVNERELYKGCPLIGDIDAYLKEFGFVRFETEMTNFGWGDAFFIGVK